MTVMENDQLAAVVSRLDTLATGQANMAVSVAMLGGKVDMLDAKMGGQIAGLDQRIRAQEQAPSTKRDTINVVAIVSGVFVALIIGLGTIGCSGLTLLVALYRLVNP